MELKCETCINKDNCNYRLYAGSCNLEFWDDKLCQKTIKQGDNK
jgi:hypothetical protein